LFRSEESEKKCNPPAFNTRTDPEPGGNRCCEAWKLRGAAVGLNIQVGSLADFAVPTLEMELFLTPDRDIVETSAAELLNPIVSHPYLNETLYVTDGPNPFGSVETVPT
jgi:hypothetical protein